VAANILERCRTTFRLDSLFVAGVQLMMSRILTSVSAFRSRDHLRMTAMRLSTKFGADIFIQSGDTDSFLNSVGLWTQDCGVFAMGFSRYGMFRL